MPLDWGEEAEDEGLRCGRDAEKGEVGLMRRVEVACGYPPFHEQYRLLGRDAVPSVQVLRCDKHFSVGFALLDPHKGHIERRHLLLRQEGG